MDVVVWLRGLGLGKYEAAFRENEIDETVLASLTHETLKEIGVTAVGHRLKLLDAIAALPTDANAKPPPPEALSTFEKPAQDTERRQVTVMFSDLVGSTALSARMDPEDLREVISAYQKCVAESVQRFGGFTAKYMCDGVLVYFGYPQAHEDDAERAVRGNARANCKERHASENKPFHASPIPQRPRGSAAAIQPQSVAICCSLENTLDENSAKMIQIRSARRCLPMLTRRE
jgi:hypothetical protein